MDRLMVTCSHLPLLNQTIRGHLRMTLRIHWIILNARINEESTLNG